MPAGIGETVFDKLDASLAKAVVSIGAVKGVEIGDGFEASKSHGSSNNDAFTCQNGAIIKRQNHAGGILGGMSDGSELILRAAFKPTPSISKEQQTINTAFEDTTIAHYRTSRSGCCTKGCCCCRIYGRNHNFRPDDDKYVRKDGCLRSILL